MRVYILLFDAGTDNEGIHTVQVGDRNTILMFKEEDDAIRYAGLLEAQDFPEAKVEEIDSEEVEQFCKKADYNWELVDSGKLAIPPDRNLEGFDWDESEEDDTEFAISNQDEKDASESEEERMESEELERIRRQLEGLL